MSEHAKAVEDWLAEFSSTQDRGGLQWAEMARTIAADVDRLTLWRHASTTTVAGLDLRLLALTARVDRLEADEPSDMSAPLLRTDLGEANQRIADLEGDSVQLTKSLASQALVIHNLQSELDAASAEINELEGERTDLQLKVGDLDHTNAALVERIVQLETGSPVLGPDDPEPPPGSVVLDESILKQSPTMRKAGSWLPADLDHRGEER